MSNSINFKRGLDIPISGEAVRKTGKAIAADVVAVKPTHWRGLLPRLLVREGDHVLAGSPVMADKTNPDILLVSPVSGEVQSIVRGEKRKLLQVLIKADGQGESVDFGAEKPADAEAVKAKLLKSGLWPSIIQRPYGVVADPAITPKAIFISAFSSAPLAADTTYTLEGRADDLQTGLDALGKLAKVHLCVKEGAGEPFSSLKGAEVHTVSGKHPAGNVGVQISAISPIAKEQTVWTVPIVMVAAIGKLFRTGKVDLARKVAVTGPRAIDPQYVEVPAGVSMKSLASFYDNSKGDIRFVSGDVLSGENVGADGYMGLFDTQVTLLHEGTERELLGWAKPFRGKFSSSRTYFSWLCPKKKYDMDTNTNGGVRAFVVSDVYGKVLPMDIFPVYLVKACLARDIEKMEQFGIYEVLPEDLATCEYVDPSKNDIQAIISDGIDYMMKEMA